MARFIIDLFTITCLDTLTHDQALALLMHETWQAATDFRKHLQKYNSQYITCDDKLRNIDFNNFKIKIKAYTNN